jgi:hypothetical protein
VAVAAASLVGTLQLILAKALHLHCTPEKAKATGQRPGWPVATDKKMEATTVWNPGKKCTNLSTLPCRFGDIYICARLWPVNETDTPMATLGTVKQKMLDSSILRYILYINYLRPSFALVNCIKNLFLNEMLDRSNPTIHIFRWRNNSSFGTSTSHNAIYPATLHMVRCLWDIFASDKKETRFPICATVFIPYNRLSMILFFSLSFCVSLGSSIQKSIKTKKGEIF